ncbi:hypothetical protein QUF70_18320, partial [Desulfobacterales bacterium HSG17]|nr:hypothetical protein [Desulfobacterales bacterium HSG17]
QIFYQFILYLKTFKKININQTKNMSYLSENLFSERYHGPKKTLQPLQKNIQAQSQSSKPAILF